MKNVLITGGSGGIGQAAVRAFAAAGYRVAAVYHGGEERARRLKESLENYPVHIYACDLREYAQVQALYERVTADMGRVDVLVNCAGIARQGLFQDVREAELRELFDVNFFGAWFLTQACLPAMISRKSGAVLNVGSMWGVTGASCEVAYSASKAALLGMTKALAKEVGPSGVRVNAVAPGVIMTDMMKGYSPETLADLAEQAPLCRLGRPEDVAELLVYLASERASFITGQVISCDGGMVI